MNETTNAKRIEDVLKAHGFEVTLEIEPENDDPRGHFSSGDDEMDRKDVEDIERRRANGDEWAWFVAHVRVSHPSCPSLHGDDYLGGCNYTDEADFRGINGQFDDMALEAFDSLVSQVANLAEVSLAIAKVRKSQAAEVRS